MGSIPDFVLCGVKVDMGCMNLVTVISSYTRVPVTLTSLVRDWRTLIQYNNFDEL